MVLYNISLKVDHEIDAEWKQWMIATHIPEVMATNCFSSYHFGLLLGVDNTEGNTYVVQYFAQNQSNFERYKILFAPDLQQKTKNKYGEKILVFRTLMEIIASS